MNERQAHLEQYTAPKPISVQVFPDRKSAYATLPILQTLQNVTKVPVPAWSNTFSPCDRTDKQMEGIICCLGVVAAGLDHNSQEVSALYHLDPQNMAFSEIVRLYKHIKLLSPVTEWGQQIESFFTSLLLMRSIAEDSHEIVQRKREESNRNFSQIFSEFAHMTIPSTRSVGIVGGFANPIPGDLRDYPGQYKRIVKKTQRSIKHHLKVKSPVLAPPKTSINQYQQTDVIYLTNQRLAVVIQN